MSLEVHNVFSRAIPGAFGVDFLMDMITQCKYPIPPMENTLLQPFEYEKHRADIRRIDLKIFGDTIEDEELQTCKGWVIVEVGEIATYPVAYVLTQGSHIRSLAVRKMLQKKGLGAFLLKYALDNLPKPITLNLDVNWNYATLKKFYWKRGFDFSGKFAENGNEIWTYNKR